jgi:hypothetical protein
MSTFWIILNCAFAVIMFNAATEEVKEKSKGLWFLMIFGSAWNAASAAASLL